MIMAMVMITEGFKSSGNYYTGYDDSYYYYCQSGVM